MRIGKVPKAPNPTYTALELRLFVLMKKPSDLKSLDNHSKEIYQMLVNILLGYYLIFLIVLAAGLSKRFGRNKLLEKIDDSTIIERVVKSAVASKADEIIVILGHEAQMIKNALKDVKCRFIYNENYEIGQSSSVKVGVNSVMDHAEAILVLPGDVALISPEAINMVIEEYIKSRHLIVVASHRGKLGHPILFDRSLFSQIMSINEETMGLKSVVNANRGLIRKVETGSDEILIDFDTEKDFKRYFSTKGTEDQ